MSKEDWLLRCSLRLQLYGYEAGIAREVAETLLKDICGGDTSYDPLQVADEEVSYWD